MMTQPSDIGDAVVADLEARYEAARQPKQDEIDADGIELLVLELHRVIDKANRLTNLLLNRQGGLPISAVDCLQELKMDYSRLRYHLDHPQK